ncbi:glycosyltransferase family 2 protein, partial [Paracoccus sp. MC1854]|nr:glycosyltransferase family 2 protein [Paracoccus sp. MC1854]
LLLAWPLQVLRLRLRGEPWERALFLTLAKFPEAQGVLRYAWQRLRGGQVRLIEYKRPENPR